MVLKNFETQLHVTCLSTTQIHASIAPNTMSSKKESKPVQDSSDPVPDFNVIEGPVRPFLVSAPPADLHKLRVPTTSKEKIIIAALLSVTAAIRLYNLPWPDSVVFDEVHFGGFASKYIKGIFFMDVHPPLAKMLFAGIGSLAGFKGDFSFDNIGDKFPATTPYFFMRLFSASLGVMTVLLLYLTLRASGVRIGVAFIAGLCFAVENSYVTISRYILLDAPLIFFIASAVYSFKRYEIYPEGSWKSYKSLLATGMALGLAVSSKWVGLFTIAWIGLLCIWRLWFMVGDLSRPICKTVKEATNKLILLLGVPAILYMLFFYIHFETLSIYSDGAGFLSSAFRTTFQGNTIPSNILADVGIGSTITIRHVDTMGGYLHSHDHLYQGGSQQQQITLYPHLDNNNDWLVEDYEQSNIVPTTFANLTDGMKIRLKHINTHRRLHSHDHKAPVSESADWQKEVSCYGFEGFDGDANDDFVVEIDKDASAPGEAQNRVRALETKFRLRHAMTGCYLFSHEVKLPKWGFEQQEVTCASQGKPALTLWYVEGNENPLLPPTAERISYKKPSFFQKFWESQQKMWHINKNLNEPHIYESQPYSWPFLQRGISYWAQDHRQVYLFGNVVMWWSVTAFIGLFAAIVLWEVINWQLGKPILQDSHVINFHIQVIHYLLGFAIHYAPSFLMGRQLFLHHYLPAYYFGILALAHALDIVVSYVFRKKAVIGYGVIGVFFSGVIYFFITYRAIIYGTPWTSDLCQKSQLLSGWDYSCSNFLSSYEEYATLASQSSNGSPISPSKTAVADADTQPTSAAAAAAAQPEKEINIDSVFEEPGNKRFVDQDGNELDPEVAEDILKNQGGSILSVAHKSAKDLI